MWLTLKHVTFSIPQLVPEEVCRDVPKELCQIVFLNPKTVKVYGLFVLSLFKFKAFLSFYRLLILLNTARTLMKMKSMKGSILSTI